LSERFLTIPKTGAVLGQGPRQSSLTQTKSFPALTDVAMKKG
jgi:hypothetical protein